MEDVDRKDITAYEDEYVAGSIDEDVEWEWSVGHLVIGIGLPAIPWILMHAIGWLRYFQLRPWLANTLISVLHASAFITVIVYYLLVRKRFELRPLGKFPIGE